MSDRFKIVYEKLDEALLEQPVSVDRITIVSDELDEIAELRRLSAEFAEPELRSYTIS